jgi:MFS family permease
MRRSAAYNRWTGRIDTGLFITLFSVGGLFSYVCFTCVYTAIEDVIEPRSRATAMALYFIFLYLLGGGLGPIVVGLLSDHFSHLAMLAAGTGQMNEAFRAVGLHDAMLLIPVSLLSMLALLMGARTFTADAHRQNSAESLGAPQVSN